MLASGGILNTTLRDGSINMAADASRGFEAKIPLLIEFDPKAKDLVIGSIRLVLQRLQKKELVRPGLQYADLLSDPHQLKAFISAFKRNRDIAADVAVDAAGRPVTSDDAELVCGPTLAQIERVLVYTFAKRVFDGQVPDEIKEYIAFEWQLPLMGLYRRALTPDHFRALGAGVLMLRTSESVRAISEVRAADVKKARLLLGDRFEEMLLAAPLAARGAALCDQKLFRFFERVTGPGIWTFLAGDAQLVVELIGADRRQLEAIGPSVADLCLESLHELERVSRTLLGPLMDAFREVFGVNARAIIGDSDFSRLFLHEVVERFKSLGQKGEEDMTPEHRAKVTQAVKLKWTALEPRVMAWLGDRRQDDDGPREQGATAMARARERQAEVDRLLKEG